MCVLRVLFKTSEIACWNKISEELPREIFNSRSSIGSGDNCYGQNFIFVLIDSEGGCIISNVQAENSSELSWKFAHKKKEEEEEEEKENIRRKRIRWTRKIVLHRRRNIAFVVNVLKGTHVANNFFLIFKWKESDSNSRNIITRYLINREINKNKLIADLLNIENFQYVQHRIDENNFRRT